jgi:DNA-binding response OmpR family regulator
MDINIYHVIATSVARNHRQHYVIVQGNLCVVLQVNEYIILKKLMDNVNKPVKEADLFDEVSVNSTNPGLVYVYVHKLRMRLVNFPLKIRTKNKDKKNGATLFTLVSEEPLVLKIAA